MRTISILAILVLLALAVPASPAHAGGVVTVCDEAHLLAALAGGGTVTFACSGTITLSNTITIAADTTIDGGGQDVTISGNNTVRVFTVNPGIRLKLNGLTVADGFALAHDGGGGGIQNNGGTVIVSNCVFTGNQSDEGGGIASSDGGAVFVRKSAFLNNVADFGGGINNWGGTVIVNDSAFSANNVYEYGGGIYSGSGKLVVSDSTFDGNIASGGAGLGGAIYNASTAEIIGSSFTDNSAFGSGGGGGIYNDHVLDVTSSWFSGNSASGPVGGGGISNIRGNLTVSNSTFSGNTALVGSANHGGGGGGIVSEVGESFGTLAVSNCTFVGNTANGADYGCGGGGINVSGGPWATTSSIVNNSIFSGNTATGAGCGGGAIRNSTGNFMISNSTFHNNISDGGGGGIFNSLGLIYLSGSTLLGNYAYGSNDQGGGVYNHGTLIASNNTFYSNRAGSGGGIYIYGTLDSSNNTFAGNYASSGGGIYNGHPFGVQLRNTIVVSSPATTNCFGSIFDGGGNLSYPDTTCPGINADPWLGPLQDNGGPTWTMALGPGSAALDAGDDAICAAPPVNNLDQRGFPRPWGAHCDIGAVEQVQEPVAVRLSTINAGSTPGAVAPTAVAGLLLLALGGCAAWGRRETQQVG